MLNLLPFHEKKKIQLLFFFISFKLFLFQSIQNSPIGDIAVSVNTVHGLAPGLCLFRA